MAVDTKEMLKLIDSFHTVLGADSVLLEVILIGIHLELVLYYLKYSSLYLVYILSLPKERSIYKRVTSILLCN